MSTKNPTSGRPRVDLGSTSGRPQVTSGRPQLTSGWPVVSFQGLLPRFLALGLYPVNLVLFGTPHCG
jgi:hypothetical protein